MEPLTGETTIDPLYVAPPIQNQQPQILYTTPIPQPQSPNPLTWDEKIARQERKRILLDKYSDCVLKSIEEYKMYAGYSYDRRNEIIIAKQYITGLFINNPNITYIEKQQILYIYIEYYNKLNKLIVENFQKKNYNRGTFEDQQHFLTLLTTEIRPPIEELRGVIERFGDVNRFGSNYFYELSDLTRLNFKTNGDAYGSFRPPMTMPQNIIEIMIKRLRCFLDYCYEFDPDYDFKNYLPNLSGGNTKYKRLYQTKKKKRNKKKKTKRKQTKKNKKK